MRRSRKIVIFTLVAIAMLMAGPVWAALQPSATVTPLSYTTAPQNAFTAITASVTEANSPVIDMTQWDSLQIDVVLNSGSGTLVLQVLGSASGNAGTFIPLYRQSFAPGGAWELVPNISATASRTYTLWGVPCRYLKLVPTDTGTNSWTVIYTKRDM